MEETVKIHKFEAAGLGKAPYKFLRCEQKLFIIPGFAPRAGSSCCYCGTSIANCYLLQSADGKQFHVGCECIRKAGDAGLMKIVKEEEQKKRAMKAQAARVATVEELDKLIADHGPALAALPHPKGFINRGTGMPLTYLDNAKWYRENAGTAGRKMMIRAIKNILSL